MSTTLARRCLLSTNLTRFYLFICLGLLTLLAGAAIGLKRTSYSFVHRNAHFGGPYGDVAAIDFLPLHLNHAAPAALTMTAGGITLFCSGIAFILIILKWPRSTMFNYQLSITLIVQTLFVLIAFADVFVIHATSAHFDPSYKSRDGGTFDLETWTCDLAREPVKPVGTTYRAQCRVEEASRWTLVPMFILSVAALLPLCLRLATERSRNEYTKQEEGYELEAAGETRYCSGAGKQTPAPGQ